MKVLIVYDSLYGNTEQIARAIGKAIKGEAKILRVAEASPAEVGSFDLLIVGSPTQGGKATKAIRDYLKNIPPDALKNVKVASFDTRVKNLVANIFGFAAGRIAESLKGKGSTLLVPPEGFIVVGGKGPLKQGELERAAIWVEKMLKTL